MTLQNPPPVAVQAAPGSQLEALAAEYARLKPAADAAAKRLKEITDALKVALTDAAPGQTRVKFAHSVLEAPLLLQAKTSWRLDTTKLKTEDPVTYVRYASQSTVWELRQVTP